MDSGSMGNHKRSTMLVEGGIILGAAIILALGAYWLRSQSRPASENITAAPPGQVVSDFPAELLIESGAFVEKSVSINYGGGANQPTVTYVSNRTLRDNIDAFHIVLERNGWQIMSDADPNTPLTFIYAEKGESSLNITFDASNEDAVKVTATYASS